MQEYKPWSIHDFSEGNRFSICWMTAVTCTSTIHGFCSLLSLEDEKFGTRQRTPTRHQADTSYLRSKLARFRSGCVIRHERDILIAFNSVARRSCGPAARP